MPGESLWSGFAYTDGNGYSNSDGSSVGNAHGNGYINGSSVGNAYSNGDGNWSAVYPDAQTSSHRAAASIDCEADFKDSNGNSRANLASSLLADGSHDSVVGRLATASPSCGARVVCAC